MEIAITSDNPIFKKTLEEHDGWWISDIMLDCFMEGLPIGETCLCLKEQGFLE